MLQSSLHVLSVLLVIHHIDSTNINEPLIDTHTTRTTTTTTTIKIVAHELPSMSPSLNAIASSSSSEYIGIKPNQPIIYRKLIDKSRPTRNQSIDNSSNLINQTNVDNGNISNATVQIQFQMPITIKSQQPFNIGNHRTSISSTTIRSDLAKSMTSNGKVYNKNDLRKRKIKSTGFDQLIDDWKCPNFSENTRYLECGCDLPYTLRCSGDIHGLVKIAQGLRTSIYPVSLLDCTLKNVTFLSDARIFENVSLHGLVISSGEIKRVHRQAFLGLRTPLQALGLPNNALSIVPSQSLAPLTSLDRLDLSGNRIKYLESSDFLMLQNLSYLELSDNNISDISLRSFITLKKLQTLKLNGNRLESGNSLQSIGQCVNLKELDLSSNFIRGPLRRDLLPLLKSLESLNLGTNFLTSVHTGALENFPFLMRLTLRHNQIDVLQDHAFSGLASLQMLDLSYNGIIAISGASLKHLSRLLVLNLTHNFLRALTSDLITPLPSLKELRLDGNDISMVSKNVIGSNALETLSLKDNPLSCDCALKPFAEWMQVSKISTQDQMSAVCATPPHLEGATLQEIPLESLNCDGHMNSKNNQNVFEQLEIRSRENNLTFEHKFSDDIVLKNIHLSMDYGLILTWNVMLDSSDFSCDAIFVYKESKFSENLLENQPVHCESNKMENENIVSVILYDTTRFTIGDKYRFCLVLVQNKDDQQDLVVGCWFAKLKQIENIQSTEKSSNQLLTPISITPKQNEFIEEKPSNAKKHEVISDISSFEKITELMQNDHRQVDSNRDNDDYDKDIQRYTTTKQTHVNHMLSIVSTSKPRHLTAENAYASQLMNHFNDTFMPSLSIGVLIILISAFIWAVTKISYHRRAIPSTVCYAADQHSVDIENSNRYLKLTCTTTL